MQQTVQEVVYRQSDLVYRLALARMGNRPDAEDLYQEVFLRYMRTKPRFDSDVHEKAWFIRVTINCAKSLWASSWRRKVLPLGEEIVVEDAADQELYIDLQQLPAKYREVLHLFYYEDYSVEEIAQLLQRKPSTVRTQLTRGRRQLKQYLQEEEAYVQAEVSKTL